MSARQCLSGVLELCENGYSEQAIHLMQAWFQDHPVEASVDMPPGETS